MKEIEKFHEDLILWVGADPNLSQRIREIWEGKVAVLWMSWPVSWERKLKDAAVILMVPSRPLQRHLDFWGDDNASW